MSSQIDGATSVGMVIASPASSPANAASAICSGVIQAPAGIYSWVRGEGRFSAIQRASSAVP